MEVLVQFVKDNQMRLTDLFFRFDKDRNDKISKVELVKGLMNAGLKMDKVILVIKSIVNFRRSSIFFFFNDENKFIEKRVSVMT